MPLIIHMQDSAVIAEKLWNCWLSPGVKKTIIEGTGGEEQAEKLMVFLAAIHDLGKATPVFQTKGARPLCRELDEQVEEKLKLAGLPLTPHSEFAYATKTPHALATQILLEEDGCPRSVAAVLGAHHGKPTSRTTLNSCGTKSYGRNYHLGREGKKAWHSVQIELMEYALNLAGLSDLEVLPHPDMASQVLLSGFLVMCDWIASNETYFPYMRLEDSIASLQIAKRGKRAWEQLALSQPWEATNNWMNSDLYQERFGFRSTTMQKTVAAIAGGINSPGILVLEAPMGVGKTEAALVVAEIFAQKTHRQGVFFALPTQATSDGIFPRLKDWIARLDEESLYTVSLAHGKAQFNEEYQTLKNFSGSSNIAIDEETGAFVHEWFEGQKKSLLADFVVGTIDQLLLAALKQKHIMLRHLGLANKVVIIDECHAYDAYMGQYLNRALNWLGAYGVPVIVLSATLPAEKRKAVIDAYLNRDIRPQQPRNPLAATTRAEETPLWAKCREYPLITYSDKGQVLQEMLPTDGLTRDIEIKYLTEDALPEKLKELLYDGGCAGILLNTVKKAQAWAKELKKSFGEKNVELLHSRFLAPDRAKKERELLKEMGKPGGENRRPALRIVVGTQVLEQSLDIDFDVLITDLCPMDLLLQRIGRLHRHQRKRPLKLALAKCFIMGGDDEDLEPGTEKIYGQYLLMRTKRLLPPQLSLPADIPGLVQDVYDDNISFAQEISGYAKAQQKWKDRLADKEERAQKFRINPAWRNFPQTLVGWLDSDLSQHQGEAAVRDTDESIEVLLIQEKNGGRLHLLPGMEQGREISLFDEVPDPTLARALARQRVRLPNVLCKPWYIEKTIAELEKSNSIKIPQWQQSPWLKGELVLILNASLAAKLGDYLLTYSQQEGLSYVKEKDVDAEKGI